MKLSPNHLKRYQEIAQLFWKYGRSDLVTQMGIDEAVDPKELKPAKEGEALPDQLADDLEAMGPTYVKLGQVHSGRPDLLPEPYLKALARLQDKVKPFSFAEVEGIQKVVNRIRAGLILAALIMGASQLMQVQTSFHFFGYPGLAILCFLAAAAGGFWLVISIFVQDHKARKKPTRS